MECEHCDIEFKRTGERIRTFCSKECYEASNGRNFRVVTRPKQDLQWNVD